MKFAYFENVKKILGKPELDVLRFLERPSLFRIKGKDSSQAVLVSALLHGCEPAGFRAFITEINSKPSYARDVFFFIGNVKAAQLQPIFTHRLLPDGDNYNRIWTENPRTQDEFLAAEIFTTFKKIPLVAHLDLHSFTAIGSKPHALCLDNHEGLELAKKLAADVFIADVPLNSLIERTRQFGPCCVVECGTNNSLEADAYALKTLQKFYYEFKVKPGLTETLPGRVFANEVNFKIKPEVSVSFNNVKQPVDLTLRKDWESLNLKKIPAGEFLGWSDTVGVFVVKDKTGIISPGTFMEVKKGKIFTKQAVVPNLLSTHEERMKESGFYFFKQYPNL